MVTKSDVFSIKESNVLFCLRDIFGRTTLITFIANMMSKTLSESFIVHLSPKTELLNVHAQKLLMQRRPSKRSHSVLLCYKLSPQCNKTVD